MLFYFLASKGVLYHPLKYGLFPKKPYCSHLSFSINRLSMYVAIIYNTKLSDERIHCFLPHSTMSRPNAKQIGLLTLNWTMNESN